MQPGPQPDENRQEDQDRAQGEPFDLLRHLVGNAFWLLVPILLLNGLWADRLPAGYQPPRFDEAIPAYIALPEQLLRVITFTLPCFVPLSLHTRVQRLGMALFVIGTAVYASSWWLLIAQPSSALATSAVGFLAPAYTPALWLAGLVLLSERTVIPRLPYRRWAYGVIAGAFLLCHNLHAWLVYTRLPHGPAAPTHTLLSLAGAFW